MRTVTRGRTLATLALLATVVAACSSGSGATSAPTTAASAPAASRARSVGARRFRRGGRSDRPAPGRGQRPLRRLPEHHARARPGGPRRQRPAEAAPAQRQHHGHARSTRARRQSRRSSPDAIDITYIGPNPAINAFAKSNGEAVRIISGATSGGAFLVVKPEITTRGRPQGQEARHPAARQHAGRRAALLAQGAGPDDRHRRRRRRLDRARRRTRRRSRRSRPATSTAPGCPSRGRPGWSRRAAARSSSTSATCGRTASSSPPTSSSPPSSSTRTPTSSSSSSRANSRPSTRSTRTRPTAQATVNDEIEKFTTKKLEPRASSSAAWNEPHLHPRPDRVLAPEVGHRRRGARAARGPGRPARASTT